jgi:hypothetical protein
MFFSALHMEQFLCAWAEADRSRRQVHSVLRAELASLPATATPSIRPVQALVYLPAALLADVVRACMGPIIVVLEEEKLASASRPQLAATECCEKTKRANEPRTFGNRRLSWARAAAGHKLRA